MLQWVTDFYTFGASNVWNYFFYSSVCTVGLEVSLFIFRGQQFAQQIQQQNPELIEQLRNHIRSRSFSGSAEEHSWSPQVRKQKETAGLHLGKALSLVRHRLVPSFRPKPCTSRLQSLHPFQSCNTDARMRPKALLCDWRPCSVCGGGGGWGRRVEVRAWGVDHEANHHSHPKHVIPERCEERRAVGPLCVQSRAAEMWLPLCWASHPGHVLSWSSFCLTTEREREGGMYAGNLQLCLIQEHHLALFLLFIFVDRKHCSCSPMMKMCSTASQLFWI